MNFEIKCWLWAGDWNFTLRYGMLNSLEIQVVNVF